MSNKNIIKIGKVTLNTDDSEAYPKVQSYFNGKAADIFLVQPYGLTSRPPENDSLVAILSQQGNEGARMGFQFCPSLRKKGIKSGEVVLENMMAGSFFYLKADGDLEIIIPKNIIETCKNITLTAKDANLTLDNITINAKDVAATLQNVTITATKITLNSEVVINGKTTIVGQTTITGNVATTGTLTNNTKAVGSTHTHGGVQTGGGNTAIPN